MRKVFAEALVKLAQKDKRIWLLTGDLGFGVLESFAKKFPQRYLNVGVAEHNLVTVAAGLASTGKIPFVYSIATFMSMRAYEHIRNDICLQNLNVKIVGTGGGLAYGKAGATHHSMEDIAILRPLPNISILVPADSFEVKEVIVAAATHKGPVYIRLGWEGKGEVHKKKPAFALGNILALDEKVGDLAILATGAQVSTGVDVAYLLSKKKIKASAFSVPSIKPFDFNLLKKISKKVNYIATIEEHSIYGGLGSIVSEFIAELNDEKKPMLLRFGLRDEFSYGSRNYDTLMEFYGLTPQRIAKKILKFFSARTIKSSKKFDA